MEADPGVGRGIIAAGMRALAKFVVSGGRHDSAGSSASGGSSDSSYRTGDECTADPPHSTAQAAPPAVL